MLCVLEGRVCYLLGGRWEWGGYRLRYCVESGLVPWGCVEKQTVRFLHRELKALIQTETDNRHFNNVPTYGLCFEG